jgi:hypothetical protein
MPLIDKAAESSQRTETMQLMLADEGVRGSADAAQVFLVHVMRNDALELLEYALNKHRDWLQPRLTPTNIEALLYPSRYRRGTRCAARVLELFSDKLDDGALRRLLHKAVDEECVDFVRHIVECREFDVMATETKSVLSQSLLSKLNEYSGSWRRSLPAMLDVLLALPQFNPFYNGDYSLLINCSLHGQTACIDRLLNDKRCDLTKPLTVAAPRMSQHEFAERPATPVAQYVLESMLRRVSASTLHDQVRVAAQILDRCQSVPRASLKMPRDLQFTHESIVKLLNKYNIV